MFSVNFCMKYSFETKELLNFHRPEPFLSLLKRWKEQKRAEWSVDMAHKISESLTTSWKLWKQRYSQAYAELDAKSVAA